MFSCKPRSFDEIPLSALMSQVNTTFLIKTGVGNSVGVKLAAVKIRPAKPLPPGRRPLPNAGHEQFSLFFAGDRGDLLEQNLYTITHESLGRFELFLVPICTRNHARIDYEAVVSRPGCPSLKLNPPPA